MKKRVWLDGSTDDGAYIGNLLSDNIGYYGSSIPTGMAYSYQNTVLLGDGDTGRDKPGRQGRKLMDGYVNNIYETDAVADGYAKLVFDFQRNYRFFELDFATTTPGVRVLFSAGENGRAFEPVCEENGRTEGGAVFLIRGKLTEPLTCRYIQMEVWGNGPVSLCQFYAWGDADPAGGSGGGREKPQPLSVANSVAMESVAGINRTAFRDVEAFEWSQRIRESGGAVCRAVWSRLDTWGEITYRPILPEPDAVNPALSVRMVKNESRCVCLALTSVNPFGTEQVTVEEIQPPRESGVTGKAYAMGAIPSLWYGVNSGPMFDAENKISKAHMEKYLTNGEAVCGFPQLSLQPCGSVLLWVKLTSETSSAGRYTYRLSAGGASVSISVEVVDLLLPNEKVRICAYSAITRMLPFHYEDRYEREIAYQNELGINRFCEGWPEPGSYLETARKLCGNPIFGIWAAGRYGHDVYNNDISVDTITEEMRADIHQIARELAAKAKSLGLDYQQWEAESADEPGTLNAEAFGKLLSFLKEADGKIQIYANPAFWVGWENGAVSPDGDAYRVLKDWYNTVVDSSCPLVLNLRDRPKSYELYTAPRGYNTFYSISAQHMKSERRLITESHRELAWIALRHGFNGWSFYAYYRPEGDPWDDFDGMAWSGLPDYELVYPGELGPVPTRSSEACREGWQDYRLMRLLEKTDPDAFTRIVSLYACGSKDFDGLRELALDALLDKSHTVTI